MNKKPLRKRDWRLLMAALVLLLGGVLLSFFSGERDRERRETALASVPDFPAPNQVPRARPPKKEESAPLVVRPPPPKIKHDRLNNFALAPAKSVAVIQVNALFNTPLFDRFKQCAPTQFKSLEDAMEKHGIDLERDIDRAAMVPGGMAVSGFFEGKPLAEDLARSSAPNNGSVSSSPYRGQTIYQLPSGGCIAQLGNLMVMGQNGNCESLVDRALDDSSSDDDAAQQLYGDLYARLDLTNSPTQQLGMPNGVDNLLSQLDGATIHANVWDDVALTLDAQPSAGASVQQLAEMARGAVSLGQRSIDDDNIELSTLSQLAKVNVQDGKLHADLALPGEMLIDKLQLPCPGRADAGE